jgi:hypothetical protein
MLITPFCVLCVCVQRSAKIKFQFHLAEVERNFYSLTFYTLKKLLKWKAKKTLNDNQDVCALNNT